MSNVDRDFIGSSDIATILGLNPYNTILGLWAEKTGQARQKDLSDNEAVEWGARLERVVAKKFAEKHGAKLIAYKKRFIHPKHLFLSCELDNIISGTDELVEIKTCNLWAYKDWQNPDDIPAHYLAQVMYQLGLSKRKIGWIAVLCGGQKYLEKRIDFDCKVFDVMVERAVSFWNDFVLPKKMPMMISYKDSAVLAGLYPNAIEQEPVDLGDEANRIIEHLEAMQQDLGSLKAGIDKGKNELKALLKSNEEGRTGIYKVTWKNISKKEYTVPAQNYRELRYGKIEEGKNG
jgi:putative phage-type endonuclease